jgi:hypothetical protein
VLKLDPDGQPTGARAGFVRGADGRVVWLRVVRLLYRRT